MNTPNMKELESAFRVVLTKMELDLENPNLKDTPQRLAKMYVNELFKGVYQPLPDVVKFPNKGQGLFYTKVPFSSTCAHHFQPVKGCAHIFVDYTKCESVIGLSKFNRIVEHIASKPTLQEDITVEIVNTLSSVLGTEMVGVILKGEHSCVTDRGVCAAYSNTLTEVFTTQDVNFKTVCRGYYSE
jgi:GTP cyclohydrolase IA